MIHHTGKLSAGEFSTGLDVGNLIKIVRNNLLCGMQAQKSMRTLQSECIWSLSFSSPILVTDVASAEKSFFESKPISIRLGVNSCLAHSSCSFRLRMKVGALSMVFRCRKHARWSPRLSSDLCCSLQWRWTWGFHCHIWIPCFCHISTMTLQFLHPCLPALLRSRVNLRHSSSIQRSFLMAACLASTWSTAIQYKIHRALTLIWSMLENASKEQMERSWKSQRNFHFMSQFGVWSILTEKAFSLPCKAAFLVSMNIKVIMMTSMISMKLLLLEVLKLWVSMRLPNVTKEGICVSTTIKVESKSKNVCLLWQLGRGQIHV